MTSLIFLKKILQINPRGSALERLKENFQFALYRHQVIPWDYFSLRMKYTEYSLSYEVWIKVYYSWNVWNQKVTKFQFLVRKKQCKTWLWTIEFTKIRFSQDCVGGFQIFLYIHIQRKKTTPTIPISLGCTHILSLLRFLTSITNSRIRKNRFSDDCVIWFQ